MSIFLLRDANNEDTNLACALAWLQDVSLQAPCCHGAKSLYWTDGLTHIAEMVNV
jgi:hypothetical protein